MSFDAQTRRSDPIGVTITFEVSSGLPVTQVVFDLENDGEPGEVVQFRDARYVRRLAFKPVVNGTWPLSLTATDAAGNVGRTVCSPGVTVSF